jgi:hypothetical protein
MEKNLISKTIYKDADLASHNNIHNANNRYTQKKDKQQHQQHNHQQLGNHASPSGYYNVNIRYNPTTPEVGRLTELILSITDQKLVIQSKNMNLYTINSCML